MKQTQSTPTKIVQSFSAKLKQAVWRVNSASQWFRGQSPEAVAAPKRRVPLLILARDLYSESWESFSIRSLRAVRSIVDLRDDSTTLHFIGPFENGQRRVFTAKLSAKGQELRAKGYIVLPESLLLGAALAPGFYQIDGTTATQGYYLNKTQSVWQTVVASPLIRNVDTAKLAMGAAASTTTERLTKAKLQQQLLRGIQKVGIGTLQQGWQKTSQDKPFPWRQTLTLSAATIVVYGLLSSGYLWWKEWSMESGLAAINDEVGELLQKQSELQEARERIETLQQHQTNWQAVNQFWHTYNLIQQNSIELSFLRGDFKTFMLSGIADEALPFLQQLNQSALVASADFDAPVRANGNRQRFIISYQASEPQQWFAQLASQKEANLVDEGTADD